MTRVTGLAVLIHADCTECHHDGPPLAAFGDDGGPLCPDGQPVAWVGFAGRVMPLDAAYSSIASCARAVFQALLPPNVAACAQVCARVSADPAVQALAAAARVVDTARLEEDQRALDTRPPPHQPHRGFTGDPCGSGPVA